MAEDKGRKRAESMVPEEGARRSDLAGGAEKPLLHRPAGRRRSAVHQRQK